MGAAVTKVKDMANKNDVFEKLSDDIVISIASYNIDSDGLAFVVSLKMVNKQFYMALNPNNGSVNMLWKNICLIKFPNTRISNKLKMKRWDQYLKYKILKINEYKAQNDTYKLFSEADYNDSVIMNCGYDIEEINNLHSNMFQDEVGNNGLPKNFKWKLKCPILSTELKSIDDTTKYCHVCKKNVYEVHTNMDLKKRVQNDECVSMVVYSGLTYLPVRMRGAVMTYYYNRTHKVDKNKELRNSAHWRYVLNKHGGDNWW
eukprot:102189_1